MIVVVGQPRTGTSLAMQMLCAAGVTCTGEAPAFEDPRFNQLGDWPFDAVRDAAVKVLCPLKRRIPTDALCVVTHRDTDDQIASEWKFINMVGMLRAPPRMSRNHRRRARGMFRHYENELRDATRRNRRVDLWFADVLEEPERAAKAIAGLVGRGDPAVMARCVVARDPGNYPGLLELSLGL